MKSMLMRENVLAQVLHQRFLECAQYARLLARTAPRAFKGELHVTGLSDSAKSLILSLLHHEVRRPFFLVASDNHHASRYLQEIGNLSRYPVFFYPASEVSPYEQVLHGPDTIAGQMEVLEHIINNPDEPYIVIVPARALVQRVLDRETLGDNTLHLKAKDTLDIPKLTADLVHLGYKRENIVTLRGEFSIRGDIIDIYPSCGPPVRIELFGDEVETIRVFNIDNQRSVEDVENVTIPPRWWLVLNDRKQLVDKIQAATDKALDELSDAPRETLRSVMENDLQALQAGLYPESSEYYAPFVHDHFSSILDYVPENALVMFDEWDSVAMALKSYEQRLDEAYEEGTLSGRLLPLPRPLHLTLSEFGALSQSKQRVFLVSMPGVEPGLEDMDEHTAMVKFDCHNVDRFNNQVRQIIDSIRQWTSEGFRIVISTEQPQRVLGLLREWDCSAAYIAGSREGSNTSGYIGDNGEAAATASLGELMTGKLPESDAQRDTANSAVWITRHGFAGGFRLEDVRLISLTDAELFGMKRKPTVYRRPVAEKNYERFTAVTELNVDDYVVHVKHGIGQFVGVQRIAYDNQTREYLTIQYSGEDRLYVPVDQINLLSRYRGAGDNPPRLSRLGGAEWESTKRRVKKSIRQIAEDLVNLYAARAKQEGFACLPDTPWQYQMEEDFPFEETPDQWQAILDTKKDMESSKPMDRLICGDVGFGKTEVAIRAIFKTIMSGRQAVILVPTTILAQQHFNTLAERFAPYPIRVGLLSRFRTAKEQKDVLKRLATGECDIVVGTHRLLQKDIAFKDLGLVVIDEEHRFGVAHKEKLKQLRVMVDVMTMSATPIPRTLHMALSGTRDMSLINTPPVNRAPVKTFVGEYRPQVVRTAILHELERGGQVFFLHNRVESIERVAAEVKELIPEARICIGHGQMQERDLENVMLDFANHQFDILVCTTIIESGLDIPNANTIIIDESDKLGLAQLYQIRGRVGRSDSQAYAYCFYRPEKVLTETAQSRLKAIREFTSLGSGYQIALRDMEIRGVGNILGAEQHGHMVAVGFELYCKLLEESVAELKGEAVAYEPDTQIDINVTAFIPDAYIADQEHRIIEYKRLADVKNERELVMLQEEWRDRFGPLPVETQQLVQIVKLRLLASLVGVQAVKPDMVGVRLLVNYRLQHWLPIQARLPKHLAGRTTYKPGSPGALGPTPYILVRSEGLAPVEQLSFIEELLQAMVAYQQAKSS
jgi:transcription-repair coupling factor (superfamily II helicase)